MSERRTFSLPKEHAAGKGVACPKCGCRHLEVVRTINHESLIERKRQCRHCRRQFTTYERLAVSEEA